MENTNKNDPFDLGSEEVNVDFDPFAEDDGNDTGAVTETGTEGDKETDTEQPINDAPATQQPETTESKPATDTPAGSAAKKVEAKETDPEAGFADKSPVFEYAGATENIDDASKTFDELRIEKSSDFPELEDGKRVSWTVEYGKITKTVADPKGMSIGKMKSDIETSKEFEDSLKKRGADKNPACKIKPRVTAQSKGLPDYKGVFASVEEAESSGKVISIVPARDGKVYEIRRTEMGRFTTPITDCDMLSKVRAGFTPALPRIPADLMMKVISFFRYFTRHGADNEALLNIYWDKHNQEYIIDAPDQVVSRVSVSSHISDKFTNERYIHYMDIHSHNTMQAYFSAIDDNDEKATRLYTVIGKLNEYIPEIKTRFSNGGKFMDIEPAEVFELVGTSFPDEWKDKVRFRSPHNEPKSKINAFARLLMARDKLMEGVDDYALCA